MLDFEKNSSLERERLRIIDKIKWSICTSCNLQKELNGYKFNTIISKIFSMEDRIEFKICCNKCALTHRAKTIVKTLLLGWWSSKGSHFTPLVLLTETLRVFVDEAESVKIIEKFIEVYKEQLGHTTDIYNLLMEFNSNKY